MPHPVRSLITGTAIAVLVLAASTVALSAPAVALPAQAVALPAQAAESTVAAYDFEDGTVQGWSGRGDASVAVTTEAAHTGTHALRTTGRTAGWQGPSVELAGKLLTGATYAISGFVRLVPGQPGGTGAGATGATGPGATVQMTVQRTPAGGATSYDFVTNGQATDAAWVELRGSYQVPTDSTQLQVYIESSDPTVAYDLDDLTVAQTAPPPGGPPDQAGLTSAFEDGTAQGWASRSGTETVAASSAQAHSGTGSLLTTGRTASWMGPAHNLLGRMAKGSTYTVSVWVRLAAGEPATPMRLSIERHTAGTPSYDRIAGDATTTADGWTQLSKSYTLAYDVDFLSVYVESASGTPSFYIDDFALTYVPPLPIQTDLPAVKDVYAGDFAVGAAIGRPQTIGGHADLLVKHFNSVTPGNALKWDATEPAEGQYTWDEADAEVAFAVDHGLAIRGHTLVWHSQIPAWVFTDAAGNPMTPTPENKALLLRREENHIRAVMGRYAGKIHTWDVVNEVVDEYASDGLRHSQWYTIAGLDFIRTAFRVAHAVDPTAKLFINEYNTTLPNKRAALLALVKQLLAEGVPIDGVGHQMHIDIEKPGAAEIESTIAAFAALGLDNQITELDMSVYTNFTDSYAGEVPADVLALQGYRYAEVFQALHRQAAHISSVTVWGLADDGTWLSSFPIPRLNEPLLFDERLQAKPAYWGVVDPSRLPPSPRRLNVPAGTPKVDGNDELEWNLLPRTRITAPGGLTASFALRWDAGHLYLLADVNDTTATGGDAVDVTVGSTRYRINGSTPPRGVTAAIRHSSAGYRVEASLPAVPAVPAVPVVPAVPALSVGGTLPFALGVTDARRGGETVTWTGVLTLTDAVRHVDVPRGTPVIDGIADPVWARSVQTDTPVVISGGAGTASATVRLLWDSQRLYVLATVSDATLDASSPNVWEQDSVEIFVDPDNGKTAGYADDDGQYRVSFTNQRSLGGNFDAYAIAGHLTSATRLIPGGYVVEAAVDLATIRPATGTLLGFDLQVNDATGGTRTGARTWSDPTGLSYVNTSRWGVARLVGS